MALCKPVPFYNFSCNLFKKEQKKDGCAGFDLFSSSLSLPFLPSRDPLAQFDVEKREHEMKMKKMEQEMEEVFEMKVQEKLQKLRDIEADVSGGGGGGGGGGRVGVSSGSMCSCLCLCVHLAHTLGEGMP